MDDNGSVPEDEARVNELFREFMDCMTTGTIPPVENERDLAIYGTLINHVAESISLYVALRMQEPPNIGAQAFKVIE